jgi:hypothetical protein
LTRSEEKEHAIVVLNSLHNVCVSLAALDFHDLKYCGFDAADLKFAEFSASELNSGGFDAKTLKSLRCF